MVRGTVFASAAAVVAFCVLRACAESSGVGTTLTCANDVTSRPTKVLVIPAVRTGGLALQRLRLVQDLAVGVALRDIVAVRLPRFVVSRRRCHESRVSDAACDEGAYAASNVTLWDVYDRATFFAATRDLGLCVVEGDEEDGTSPPAASLAMAVPEMLVGSYSLSTATLPSLRRAVTGLAVDEFELAGAETSSTQYIPDSGPARSLFARLNAAFAPSETTRDGAAAVARALLARATTTTTTMICAAHWRAPSEADMSVFVDSSGYKLNATGYAVAMAAAVRQGCGDDALVLALGDVPSGDNVRAALDDAVVETKATLLPRGAWLPERWAEWNDVAAAIDFELGAAADRFVGSPLSAFSVLVDFTRNDTDTTHMANFADLETAFVDTARRETAPRSRPPPQLLFPRKTSEINGYGYTPSAGQRGRVTRARALASLELDSPTSAPSPAPTIAPSPTAPSPLPTPVPTKLPTVSAGPTAPEYSGTASSKKTETMSYVYGGGFLRVAIFFVVVAFVGVGARKLGLWSPRRRTETRRKGRYTRVSAHDDETEDDETEDLVG